MSPTDTSTHLPQADPRYLHTVGWWQGVLDHLGRISPGVAQLTPDSPITLCGSTLASRDPSPQIVTDDEARRLPECPVCAAAEKGHGQ